MNARLRANLYSAGITSPEMLRHAISSATNRATPARRLTPSRRYRRWRVIAARCVLLAIAIAAIYLNGVPQ